MQFSAELEACLREFSSTGLAELRENGTRVAPLSTLSWEVRGDPRKPLLHLWSEHHNLTRRVLAITDHSERRLALAVECFGSSKPDRLEFLRIEFDRSERELEREVFAQRMRALCEREFPDYAVESMVSSADLEHTLPANYARGVLRHGKEVWALFAVPDSPAGPDAATCLTFALLWLDRLRKNSSKKNIRGLRILMPANSSAALAHLLPVIHPEVKVQLFERNPIMETLEPVETSRVANFSSTLTPAREAQGLLDRAAREMATLLPQNPSAISFHPNASTGEVTIRFRGLACLRWHGSGIVFGARDPKVKWDGLSTREIHDMFRELEKYRHPLGSDTRHPLFRGQAERWLEFLVRQDVSRIDSTLDRKFVYGQILASTGNEHGILDVLSVTRSGRLAILELKTAEQPVFLLQAAKYWQRIQRHLQQEDFRRNGYFTDVALQRSAPIVYLVAPALRFHPATEALLRYLHPQIEIVRVGLAESWRRGLCVVLRQ